MANGNRIGVVTVTFNSSSVIDDFMASLLRQRHTEFAVYIIDNASSDDTLKRLSKYQDSRIVTLANATNLGVAEGNNIGIRAAIRDGCDAVLLINNDTEFDEEILSRLWNGLHQYGSDMIAPKIVYFDDPSTIWAAGGYFSRFWGASRHFGSDQRDSEPFNKPRVIAYSPTCCLLARKEVFQRVGLMDPAYFVYLDDTDFCFRALAAGARLLYLPSARVLHKVSTLTGGGESEFALRYCVRNEVYFFLKNMSRWKAAIYLLGLQFRIMGRQLVALRRPKTFWTLQRAFCSGFALYRASRSGNQKIHSGGPSLAFSDSDITAQRLKS